MHYGLDWLLSKSRGIHLVAAALALSVLSPPANAQTKAFCDDRPPKRTRIIGGSPAASADWPWFAALRSTNAFSKTTQALCGGTMIAPNWVLTAAHCVADIEKTFNVGPNKLDVVVGVDDLREATSEHTFEVAEIKIPDEYRAANDKYVLEYDAYQQAVGQNKKAQPPMEPAAKVGFDIALLRLTREWKGGSTVSLSSDRASDPKTSVAVRVAGFGLVKPGKAEQPLPVRTYTDRSGMKLSAGCARLMQVSMPIVETTACRTRFTEANYKPSIADAQICAGYETAGRDSCSGDSGGPLVALDASGRPFQIGLVSWGLVNCGGEKKPYGVYTRISSMAQWIRTAIGTDIAPPVAVAQADIQQTSLMGSAIDEIQGELAVGKDRVRVLNTGAGPLKIKLGKIYQLQVQSDIAGRLIMIDIDAAGKVTQILPNWFINSDSLLRIEAGETIIVPTRQRFNFDGFEASLPLGAGKVLIAVAPGDFPIDLTLNEETKVQRSTRGLVPVQSPVPYLMNLLSQIRTRAEKAQDEGATNWAFTVLNYEIEP